jgi:subtilisin family serine protease
MKTKKQIFFTAMLVVFGLVISNATSFGGTLEENNEEIVSVLVYLKDQTDLNKITTHMDEQRASLQLRHETVVVELQKTASETQPELIEYLDELKNQNLVKDYRCYWIGNIIAVDTYQYIADQIDNHKDVLYVYPNFEIELVDPVYEGPVNGPGDTREVEPGIEAIRAPEVWEMGITGEGSLVATLDTGVDGDHPALADRWAGVADPRYEDHPEWAWLDPYTYNNDFPFDSGSHGTHTMGTVCGGAPGDEVGVAPGAHWISSGAIDRAGISQTVEDAIESFEWLVDPDGNPETNWDVPDVCSNSWRVTSGHGYPPCDETFWTYLDACEAAGIVILFSAGNEGPGSETIGRPPDRATTEYMCCSVGAVDAEDPDWTIASFSSRGPSYCTPSGDEAIKPEISAPGVSVRSSVPGGGYSQYSGTSMASPHVNGVVALMRQAAPNMSVDHIKQILYETAVDLGDEGEDNDYGWGMIDAYEAVINCNEAPYRPTLEGPDWGTAGFSYEYTANGDDPEGDDLYYKFEWGDGSSSNWDGPHAPGEDVTLSHVWEEAGEYVVTVTTKDDYYESELSEPITVTVEDLLVIKEIKGGLFRANVVLKNNGIDDLSCVQWSIKLDGGAIIGTESSGEVDIPAGEEVTVQSDLILGFGRTRFTVDAEVPECTDSTWKGGFIYFIYVHVNPGGD